MNRIAATATLLLVIAVALVTAQTSETLGVYAVKGTGYTLLYDSSGSYIAGFGTANPPTRSTFGVTGYNIPEGALFFRNDLGASVKHTAGTWAAATTLDLPLVINHSAEPSVPLLRTEADDAFGDFNFWSREFANPGDATRDNRVYRFGYNLAGGGTPIVSGEPALGMEFESYYNPSGAGSEKVESHWVFVTPDSDVKRVFSWQGAIDAPNDVLLQMNANTVVFADNDAVTGIQIIDGSAFTIPSGGKIRFNLNGTTDWITQINAAGSTYIGLAALDTADRWQIGGGSAAVYFNPEVGYVRQGVTIADNGNGGTPATQTLTATTSYASLTCNDAQGCDITMAEPVREGTVLYISNVSANVCNFADTAGLSELAGSFAMGQYDSLQLLYAVDRWVELSRSNN